MRSMYVVAILVSPFPLLSAHQPAGAAYPAHQPRSQLTQKLTDSDVDTDLT